LSKTGNCSIQVLPAYINFILQFVPFYIFLDFNGRRKYNCDITFVSLIKVSKKRHERIPNCLYASVFNKQLQLPMNDSLNKLWLCRECNVKFLFISDVEDHLRQSMHCQTTEFDLLTGEVITS
jgi:hypothetical protein